MIVELLKYTNEPEKTCAIAGRLCYSAVGIEELKEQMTQEKIEDILKRIIKSGHLSVLEHASFSFGIEGVSRALLAQLTRHRIASFSVQSQRYVKFNKKGVDFVIPPTISKDEKLLAKYNEFLKLSQQYYNEFIEAGIPAEDSRYVLLRCCNRAQWEIRDMACRMLKLAKEVAPILFNDAGPNCVKGACTEDKPCGKPWKRI